MTQSRSLGTSDMFSSATFLNSNRPPAASIQQNAMGGSLSHAAPQNQATGTTVAASTTGVSALSVMSLRRNGISTTSAIPTTRLPAPSSAKSFAYPGFVATAVAPVGFGIIPEKSPAKSDARPVTSIQLPIIMP